MCSSEDLHTWSHPQCILEANKNESFYNVNVCPKLDGDGFILLVETDDPAWPKFTFRFLEGRNMADFSPIDGAVYGKDKYVGGPAIYNTGGFYYVCYLDEAPEGWITRITRSRDLKTWQDAPEDKPVLMYDKENDCHRLRGEGFKENNASDLELCEFNGKTLLYFTGGDQLVCGDLQYTWYPGSMQELFEKFFN
jgi:alpha-L-fucosidase